jgi:ligand-binding sensor domain-containing protein
VIGSGIELFDTKKGVIRRFSADQSNPNSIPSNQFRMFFEDNEKNMWVGTSNGLCRYDSLSDNFIRYSFPDNSLSSFLLDGDGKIWIGSSTNGLFHCNLDGTLIKSYTINEGLTDNAIRGIIPENNNDLWISTSNDLIQTTRPSEILQDKMDYKQMSLTERHI